MASGAKDWFADVPRSTRAPTLFGSAIVTLGVLGFGYWANAAPIAGAVVTSGVFVSTGNNKIVQHLEGGVIEEIRVREGDVVEEGQTLIKLDETAPKAELRRLILRQARLAAIEARLQAELNAQAEVRFPSDLVALTARDSDLAATVEAQRLTFKARRDSMASEIASLEKGIDALAERIAGSKTQQEAVMQQLEYMRDELEGKNQLLKGGLIRKPEVLALQRAKANLQGEVGRLIGEMGDARERIARSQEQIIGVRNAANKAAVEQMHEIRAELNDVRERIRAATSVLERVNITAPVRGTVVKMRYHTSGGVIEAGKSVMEIVPLKAELVLEARVRPVDIDNVKTGQAAAVRLTALSQRVTPMISGQVVYISADALPDEKSGTKTDLYVARIKLDAKEAAAVEGFVPTSGMPAEVYIKTAERTFFEYLLQPLKDSMSRAFRES